MPRWQRTFRSQVPARYVEGYRASGERIARAHRSGSALNLTAADAHAWTEVYLDGQGWTPIEVTPGYYSQTLDADKIVDVGEAWSNGTDDSTLDVGAVAGKAEKKRNKATVGERKAPVMARVGAAALVCVALAALALLVRMLALRHRRARDLANDDQDICIPALYSFSVLVMEQSGVTSFDETKPLECLDAFAEVFPTVDPWEYRRVIQLYQAYVFGGHVLKPSELRTLRRFSERLHQNMPAPKNVIERFRRCVLHAL
ncbi:MAG: transglutaminase domain-containing protein [Collinsella sp.]